MNTYTVQQGFTLVELIATMAVVAISLVIGVPSFREMTQSNRMTARINEFVTDLNLARSEAVKRARPVTMCKRNTAGDDCDNAATWAAGWLVFVDMDGDGTVDAGAVPPDAILRVHDAPQGITSVNSSQGRDRVTYGPDGLATLVVSDKLTFCDSRGVSKAKVRVLSSNGRLRVGVSGDTPACP